MKLIDKNALVAEIEKRLEERQDARDEAMWNDDYWPESDFYVRDKEDEELLTIINTLEVKEVDLEKEYEEFVINDPVYNKLVNGIVGKAIAKYFYSLGLKAQKGE